jgi:asparagine synthase (glutamine-hydrolysing)
MCGIIGEVSTSPVDRDRFISMRDELSHRGPDGAGIEMFADDTVALGHRRLAIIDPSNDGLQPMSNEDGTVWLVFNGEIYNFRSLREELESCGHEFESDTDSEVIVHGYEEWGDDCIERFRGMFSFGLWDDVRERLLLARDRIGIKPLYYYESQNRMIFASEPKAIVADDRIPREVDPNALALYLQYRYIPAPEAIWSGMSKLPSGHTLVYEQGDIEIDQYWSLHEHLADQQEKPEAVLEEVQSRLKESVRRRLMSDVPLGFLLSGGVDSSLVTALGHDVENDRTAFSVSVGDEEHTEIHHARTAADSIGIDLVERELDSVDISEILDDILYYYDEPLADTSVFPTMLLMDAVSEDLTVALSGDGGDELFVGYRWYDWFNYYRMLSPLAGVFRTINWSLERLPSSIRNGPLSKLSRIVAPFDETGWDRYQMVMDPRFTDEEVNELLTPSANEKRSTTDPLDTYRHGDLLTKDLQYFDIKSFLADDILVKVDRASMANSVEVRVPFLDESLVTYSMSLNTESLYRNGELKWALKSLARRYVPDSVIDRQKQGFSVPYDEMPFLEEAESLLETSRAAEDKLLSQETIDEIMESGTDTQQYTLIIFEMWYRKWVTNEEY